MGPPVPAEGALGASSDGPPEASVADIAAMRLEPLGVVEPVVVDGAAGGGTVCGSGGGASG
jgi:hypothetical protein